METVLFASLRDGGRGPAAAAIFNRHADHHRARAISAGVNPAPRVSALVVDSMFEYDLDLRGYRPRRIDERRVLALLTNHGWRQPGDFAR